MKREISITYKLDEAPYEKGTIIKEMGSHPSFQGNFFSTAKLLWKSCIIEQIKGKDNVKLRVAKIQNLFP